VKDLFKCHGCGAGGDVFSFIQQIESVSFPRALTIAADGARAMHSRFATFAQAMHKSNAVPAKRKRSVVRSGPTIWLMVSVESFENVKVSVQCG
jgi:DNA primase